MGGERLAPAQQLGSSQRPSPARAELGRADPSADFSTNRALSHEGSPSVWRVRLGHWRLLCPALRSSPAPQTTEATKDKGRGTTLCRGRGSSGSRGAAFPMERHIPTFLTAGQRSGSGRFRGKLKEISRRRNQTHLRLFQLLPAG